MLGPFAFFIIKEKKYNIILNMMSENLLFVCLK